MREHSGHSSVTLRDIAAAARVHVATVSRALDPDSRHPVSPETRARISVIAEGLGYRSHLVARGLRRGYSSTIGVVVPDLGNPYAPPILRGLEHEIERCGYMAFITESRDSPEVLQRTVKHLLARRVDGLALLTARAGEADQIKIWAESVPTVLTVRYLPDSKIPTVTNDDHAGARLAAEHLFSLGHRLMLQIPGPLDLLPCQARVNSFERAAADLGFAVRSTEPAAATTFEEGYRLMRDTLPEVAGSGVTAIFAHTDSMATGVIRAIRDAGFDCPADYSVVGYNNMQIAECVDPPLTTIHLDGYEIGRRTGRLLLSEIGATPLAKLETVVPARLVVRSSTATPYI